MSADPALASYFGNRADKLPGQGGVFNPVNLALYCYAGNNPVKYTDPNGMALWLPNIKSPIDSGLSKIGDFIKKVGKKIVDFAKTDHKATVERQMARAGDDKNHIDVISGKAEADLHIVAGDLYATVEGAVVNSDYDVEAKTKGGNWGIGLEGSGDVWKVNGMAGVQDFTLKAEAFAGMLEGETGITLRICGFETGVKVNGSLLSIGAGAKFGKEGIKLKIALLLGAGIDIDLKGFTDKNK